MQKSRSTITFLLGMASMALLIVASNFFVARAQTSGPTLTPEHKRLHKLAGTWDATVDFMGMKQKGTETIRLFGNGQWAISEFKGNFAGMPFEGLGILGYDPMKKEYVSTWIDSMSPHLLYAPGNYSKDGKTLITEGPSLDSLTGEMKMTRNKDIWTSDDTRTVTMYEIGDEGTETRTMQITYNRRK